MIDDFSIFFIQDWYNDTLTAFKKVVLEMLEGNQMKLKPRVKIVES